MLLAAARYGYPNAKVRALRSRKLTEQDRHFLLAAKDLTSCLSYLATTSYSAYLPDPEKGLSELPALERQLAQPLLDHYAKVVHSLRGAKERELILALFRRFEAENLKIVLRALFAGLSRDAVFHLLYPVGHLSDLDWDTLWACKSIGELLEHLRPDIFGRSLQHALPQFEAQGRLFPLEMALDFSCFRLLRQAISALGTRYDRTVTEKILTSYIDILNISWVIRLKIDYGLPPEEIVNYTLPEGKVITLECLNRLSRVEDIAAFINQLPTVFRHELSGVRDWGEINPALETYFLKILARIFSGQPFHIGIGVAYLLEKEIELGGLITMLQAKAKKLSAEEIGNILPWQFSESRHVQAG
jgi:V/A-type H+-transporting ATPase subunit C